MIGLVNSEQFSYVCMVWTRVNGLDTDERFLVTDEQFIYRCTVWS